MKENEKNAVAIIWDNYAVCNFQSMKSPVEMNSFFLKFFYQLTNHHIHVEVAGKKRVNRGVGLGVETPADYFLWEWKSYDMGERQVWKIS